MDTWSSPHITKRKAAIKQQLDAGYAPLSAERLQHILKQIHDLDSASDATSQLNRYIYVMSALVQHERSGGLTTTQIEKLVDIGHAILQFQGIKANKSNISFLYGELHLVRAQIYRHEGLHWRAAWEQQMGRHLSRNAPLGGDDFQHLALALRALRLGYLDVAQEEFDHIKSINESNFDQVTISRARILRFKQDWAGLESLQNEFDFERLGEIAKLEWQWEKLCVSCFHSQDYRDLALAVKRKGSHYRATYVIEAMLWALSLQTKSVIPLVPKMKTIARVESLRPRRMGVLFKAAQTLEDAYHTQTPLTRRLKQVGDMVAEAHTVTTVDKELLIWSATARWLARIKSFELAKLAITEYRSLSLRMSNGQNQDVLGVMTDLLGKKWS